LVNPGGGGAWPKANTLALMEIVRLSSALGAEIRGVDVSRTLDEATFARIRDAWHEHLVIVLRGQDLDEEAQVAGLLLLEPVL